MSVFESMEKTASEEHERVAGTRAVIAVQERAKSQFEKFVSKASSDADREYRLSFIEDKLREIVAAVAAEYNYEDEQRLFLAGTAVLGGGHASDCSCGFCANKGNLPGAKKDDDDKKDDDKDDDGDDDDKDDESESKKPWEKDSSVAKPDSLLLYTAKVDLRESMWHTSDVEDGDTSWKDRVELPVSDGTALADQGAVKTDKSRSGDNTGWDLKAIDVPSNRNPSELQAIHTTPDYEKALPGPSETGKSIDAQKGIGSEETAPHTDTWNGTEGLADPVTSAVSKWAIIES